MQKIQNILFDLDGTIVDSHKGIFESVRFALNSVGEPVPRNEEMYPIIGPPLLESLGSFFNIHGDQALRILKYYRDYYSQRGVYEYDMYPHIDKVLVELRRKGFHLFIATGKPTYYACQILEDMELDHLFVEIAGSNLDNTRTTKVEVINHLINNNDLIPEQTIIIGDRIYDIEGGKACGLRSCIGVSYGFGSNDELRNAGADSIVDDCLQLKEMLTSSYKSYLLEEMND